jgi:hypothetical protein
MARAEEAWQRLLASPEPFTSQDFALTLGAATIRLHTMLRTVSLTTKNFRFLYRISSESTRGR